MSWRRQAAAALVGASLIAGCDAGPPTAPSARATSLAPLPGTELTGLAAEVRQARADWAHRVVQVRIANSGPVDLTVSAVELETGGAGGVARSDPAAARVVPGQWHRDFSVALGAPVCAPGAGATGTAGSVDAPRVTVHVSDDAGRTSSLTLDAEDPQGHLARIHGEDCAAQAVEAAAALSLAPDLVVEDHGGSLVGVLTLTVAPHEGAPPVGISRIEGTVLLSPIGGPSWVVPALAAPVTGTTTVRLELTPSRCDAHAVAEDKRGTFLGVHASLDGTDQATFYLGVPDCVLGQVHDYVARFCGW